MSVGYWGHTLYVLLFNLILVVVLRLPHVHIVIGDSGWNDLKVTVMRAGTPLYHMNKKSAKTYQGEPPYLILLLLLCLLQWSRDIRVFLRVLIIDLHIA